MIDIKITWHNYFIEELRRLNKEFDKEYDKGSSRDYKVLNRTVGQIVQLKKINGLSKGKN